jgi:hypothetical protein
VSESLDSILSNDEAPSEDVAEQSETTQETHEAGETPAAKLDATDSETDEIDAEESDDLGDLRYSGLKKAARKERKFRQAAEKQAKDLQRQLDHLAGQMQQARQHPQPKHEPQPTEAKKEPEPGFFELGPEPYVDQRATAAAEKVREKLEQRLAHFEARQIRNELDGAEMAIINSVADGKENIDYFAELAKERDPRNGQLTDHAKYVSGQLQAVIQGVHPQFKNPAQFAYEYAKAARRAIALSDPNYEATQRAKWEAEQRGESSTDVPQARPQHKTIAGARGSSASVRRSSADPDSLREILA